jgi:hypothetical protein
MFGPLKNSTKAHIFWFKKDITALVVERFQQYLGVLCRRGTSAVVSVGCLWALGNTLDSFTLNIPKQVLFKQVLHVGIKGETCRMTPNKVDEIGNGRHKETRKQLARNLKYCGWREEVEKLAIKPYKM